MNQDELCTACSVAQRRIFPKRPSTRAGDRFPNELYIKQGGERHNFRPSSYLLRLPFKVAPFRSWKPEGSHPGDGIARRRETIACLPSRENRMEEAAKGEQEGSFEADISRPNVDSGAVDKRTDRCSIMPSCSRPWQPSAQALLLKSISPTRPT
jgi:hypothetical protein